MLQVAAAPKSLSLFDLRVEECRASLSHDDTAHLRSGFLGAYGIVWDCVRFAMAVKRYPDSMSYKKLERGQGIAGESGLYQLGSHQG